MSIPSGKILTEVILCSKVTVAMIRWLWSILARPGGLSSIYKPLIWGYFWLKPLHFHKILCDTVFDQNKIFRDRKFSKILGIYFCLLEWEKKNSSSLWNDKSPKFDCFSNWKWKMCYGSTQQTKENCFYSLKITNMWSATIVSW